MRCPNQLGQFKLTRNILRFSLISWGLFWLLQKTLTPPKCWTRRLSHASWWRMSWRMWLCQIRIRRIWCRLQEWLYHRLSVPLRLWSMMIRSIICLKPSLTGSKLNCRHREWGTQDLVWGKIHQHVNHFDLNLLFAPVI